MNVRDKIKRLRELMKENNVQAYIVPSYDAHQSEYVAEYFKCRQWISGFTGSAGTIVITLEDAGLWTDGRYYIQAENELKDTGIRLFRMVDPGVPSYTEWLKETLKENDMIGFDGRVFSINMVKAMEKEFNDKKISLKIDLDLIDELWKDRPEIPKEKIFIHDVKYAGKSRNAKLALVRNSMKAMGANYHLLSSLDDIAWLLNIRGNDVPNNPVVLSNILISMEECYLFINLQKVPNEVKLELESDGIELCDYYEIEKALKKLKAEDSIILDGDKVNASLYYSINEQAKKIDAINITTNLKSIKNETEIESLRECEINDGVAMVRFIKWLKENVGTEVITEMSADKKLQEFRSEQELFVGPSFDTIAGYKDHAAMMHYKANTEIQYNLKNEGLFLVDSGGQYFNGTTDTTRTIVLGELTEEEKKDFTLVLKGHIGLSTAKFLYGATGSNLDILARQPIWEQGLDYKCGTGHGVGFFLNVHEGPQRISQVPNGIKLEKGMIITNEPGVYKEGKHGIRTENMMVVCEDAKTEFGQFMRFESVTYCPIDLDGIDKEMLTENEIKWLNNYHKDIYLKLAPKLTQEEREWLKEQTRDL
ncbi:aminopeptidase P family protein [Clostridium sp. 'White wine YQ']|uniref:aminopeptidase P family protein n=1 Tax=Clostridium sp. 'White wine YQ' TaxID=3027474 RepID=UPI0023651A6B|nr:aminopeptidase P family protein [Clostridium sp. 'White wine YQ']MDD7793192.1 aminopeptidase P family protein [Clostridium sp. 'White wine YQ']